MIHEIDMIPFADTNHTYCQPRYDTAKSGKRLVDETDILQRLGLGEKINIGQGSAGLAYYVKAAFAYAIMKELVDAFDVKVLERVVFNWYHAGKHLKGFKEKLRKLRIKTQQPVWENPQNMCIPKIGHQFKLEEDWPFELINGYAYRSLIKQVYGDDTRIKGFNGIQIRHSGVIAKAALLKGGLFKITKLFCNRNERTIAIKLEKGLRIIIDGNIHTVTKEVSVSPEIDDFNGIKCSLNALSRDK
jgi:hypothetical protein